LAGEIEASLAKQLAREVKKGRSIQEVGLFGSQTVVLGAPVFVILDGHPIHKAAMIKTYVEQSKGMLKLFYVPPYSPHLNPDETVWAHVKRDVSRRLVENKAHMKQLALSVLLHLQKLPILIMSFFRQPECRYILE
jgi:transposase